MVQFQMIAQNMSK